MLIIQQNCFDLLFKNLEITPEFCLNTFFKTSLCSKHKLGSVWDNFGKLFCEKVCTMVMVKDEKHVYCKAHASFGQCIDKPRQLTLPESLYIGTLETTGKANK